MHQHLSVADEVGVEIGHDHIEAFGFARLLHALDQCRAAGGVQPLGRLKLFGHLPADARDPERVAAPTEGLMFEPNLDERDSAAVL